MRELGIVVSLAAFLVALQLASRLFLFGPLLGVGAILVLVGLVTSIPGAVVYHVRLVRVLEPKGLLPRGWIWHPTRLHVHLSGADRDYVLRWFYVGAAGWVMSLAGCGMALLGVLSSR